VLLSTRQPLPLQLFLPLPVFVWQPCPTTLQRLSSPVLLSTPLLLSKGQPVPAPLPLLAQPLPLPLSSPPQLHLPLPFFAWQHSPTTLQRKSCPTLLSTPLPVPSGQPLPVPLPLLAQPVPPPLPSPLQLPLHLTSFAQQHWPTNLQRHSCPTLPSTPALLSTRQPLLPPLPSLLQQLPLLVQ